METQRTVMDVVRPVRVKPPVEMELRNRVKNVMMGMPSLETVAEERILAHVKEKFKHLPYFVPLILHPQRLTVAETIGSERGMTSSIVMIWVLVFP